MTPPNQEERDFLNGDHSFSMWFKIMWLNWYIQIFGIAGALIPVIFTSFDEKNLEFYVALAVPILVMVIIGYKGFYQFWKDLLNKQSR